MHSIFNKSQKQEVKQILERWHSREKGQEVATKCDETKLVQCKQASAVSSSVFCLFCFCYCLIWEAKRQTQRWSEGGREGVRDGQMFYLSADSLHKSLEQPELRQLKVRSQKLNPSLPHKLQEPNYLSHHGCLPGQAFTGNCSGVEPGVEPRYSSVGRRHPNH